MKKGSIFPDARSRPDPEAAWENAVSLPLYPSLRDEEIDRVVAAALQSFP